MDRTLTRQPSSRTEHLTLGLVSLFVALVAVVPLASVGLRVDAESLTLLAAPRAWVLFARSLVLALSVTLGALALGVPLGTVFARARVPFRRTLFALHLLPIFLPPFFTALGWFQVFGVTGVAGNERTAALLFGPAGVFGVLVCAFSPVVTALTYLGVRALDPSLEAAARVVAPPERVLARIVVPAARPPIALAALVVFALSLGELGVPMFLRFDVYPAAVFARLGGMVFAPGEATVLSVPLVAVAAVLATLAWRILDKSSEAAFFVTRASPDDFLDLGTPAPLLAALGALPSVIPLGALAARGVSSLGAAFSWIGSSIENSLLTSLAAACLTLPSAIVLGHAAARGRPLARMLHAALLFAFFVPSTVLGIGVTATWNQPRTAALYASPAILLIAFAARYAVLGVSAFATSCAQVSRSYEDTAAVAGAGYLRRLSRIVVPMQRRGAIASFSLILVFALRDIETSVLLYPAGGEPLTVRIFTLEANGPPGVVAALASLHAAITCVVLLIIVWSFERSAR